MSTTEWKLRQIEEHGVVPMGRHFGQTIASTVAIDPKWALFMSHQENSESAAYRALAKAVIRELNK